MKRKLLFITLLMLFCSTVFGQDSYWGTPVRYPSNMTLNANIMINGTVQNSDKLEIGAFCGSELRGATITTIEDGESNVFFTIMGNNGDNISFKLYVPGDEEGTILSTDETIVFYDDAMVGFDPLLYINFYEKHWDYTGTPEHTMTIECTISVDGVIQNTENLELAAFYNDELRGVAKPKKYSDDLYLTALQVGGSNGELISFKLYNSVFGELSSDYTVPFVKDVTLGNEEKLTIEFKNNPVAMITNATGNHYFSSLEAAVAAAQPGETVVLLQNVTLTETLTIEKSITLDLNEKNVTLSTGGNMIKADATIKNGNVIIDDVDTKATANSNCFISTNVGASLTFDDINMTGNGYTTHWAVLCAMSGSSAGTGSTINITNSTITLSNEKGSQGGFIKDQSGVDNYSQINISNSTLTLTNVSRGFTGAKVTLNDVDLTITGGEHGINGSELVIKNGSNVSISNGTGRAITLNKFDASIAGSNVTISNMGEGGIRYKTANTLTVDASSTLSETKAHADVDNAKLNDKVVRGTESQMSTVKVEGGVTTVINPVSGQVAYRAYIEDSESREAVKVDLQNVNALNSLAVKLYDANGNLLTTTTYSAGAVEAPEYLTCNIVLSGTASSSWETVINVEKLTVDNYPHKAELVVDGDVINTFENILGNATDAAAYQLPAYKALGCVYKAASITREGKTEYYGTLQAAINAAAEDETVKLLADVNYSLDPSTFTAKHGDDDAALFVLADDKLTIDLNGNTISVVATLPEGAATAHSGAIINNGDLTIDDSSDEKEGKVTFKYVGIYDEGYKRHGVVMNLGTLTVNAGTLENVTELQNQQAIDNTNYNKTEVSVVINGGTIKSAGYYAIDMVGYYDFAPALKNSVVINDGTIDGGVYARIQNNTNLSLNITGGVIKSDFAEAVRYRVHYPGNTHSISITGGEFSTTNAESQVVRVQLAEGESLAGFISAGTFSQDVNEFCAAGFMCVENDNGTYGVVVDPAYGKVAKIGDTYYETLDAAFKAAQAGDVVTILAGEYTQNLNINKAITVEGERNDQNENLVNITGKLNITADGATAKNLNVNNGGSTAGYIGAKDVTVDGCTVVGGNGFRYCYTEGTVTFKDSKITGATYGIHFDGSAGGNIVIENCDITGWTSFASAITNVAITDTKFLNGNYNQLRFYQNSQMTNCKFNEEMTIDFGMNDVNAEFEGCAVVDTEGNATDAPLTDVIYLGDIAEMGVDVTINSEPVIVEAKVADNNGDNASYFLVLQEALNAAQANQTVIVISDVELENTLTVAADKTFTLDLNGKVVSGVSSTAGSSAVITNNGNLTVKTSVEGGKITSKSLQPDVNWGGEGEPSYPSYANNTIVNRGTFTLVSGTVENTTAAGGATYAIDNYNGSTTNIEGGEVYCENNLAIRLFCGDNISLNIDGGKIQGTRALWIQLANSNSSVAPNVEVNISNGEIRATGEKNGYIQALYSYSYGNDMKNVEINISGGTFYGDINLTGGSNQTNIETLNISGGIFNGNEYDINSYGADEKAVGAISITGGTFSKNYAEKYALDDGFVFVKNADGKYELDELEEGDEINISNLNELIAFRDAVNAGNDFAGQTVVLTSEYGIDLKQTRSIENWIPIGTIATPFKGTFDGGNVTISNLNVEGENYLGLFGKTDGATIKNVKINNVTINGVSYLGAIVGMGYTGTIDNCHVTGNVEIAGNYMVGGINGQGYATVNNSSVVANDNSFVKAIHDDNNNEGDNVGGIVGHCGETNTLTANTVKNITISGTRKVGGIVGIANQGTKVENCVVEDVTIETSATEAYANDNITTMSIGALIGQYQNNGSAGTVKDCMVKNVEFNNVFYVNVSVGPITGGSRGGTDGMLAPTGVTASGNNIYMSTITGSNNLYLMNAVAKIDETKYYTLQEAVDAGNGKTINVIGNTTEVINIADNAVIDLNFSEGVTLNGYILAPNADLTINDGTISNTNSAKSAVQINAGKLELNNVNITSARHAMRIEGTNGEVIATINGGTYKLHEVASQTQHVLNAGGDGSQVTVTINNGTFVGPKGTASDSGSAVNVKSGSTVTINGGEFSGGKNHTLSAAGTLIVKGGTFDQVVKGSYLAEGYVCQMNADNKYEVFFAVAKIGEVNYPSLQKAFNDVDANETITIISNVEESEVILPATLENVIVTAPENVVVKNTVIKTPEMGTTSGFAIAYEGLTFNNVNFDNSRVHLTGWANDALSQSVSIKNLVVTNCEFNNIANEENQNYAALHLNVADGVLENLTFTNNKVNGITGGESAALYGNFTGVVTITGNVIRNTSGSSMVVGYSNATINITDNILENWALSGKGRAIRLDVNNEANASTVVVRGNAMIHANAPEEFVKSTGSNTTVTLNENYWYGNSPREEGMVTAAGVVIDNYYKTCTVTNDDFELDNLVVYAKGTITHGYVNTYKIWGEGSSNSQVSFVVKVYAGETLLGQASLNDKDNIIDGDIPNVTWGIPYNTANTDEYWTVEWFEALSPSVVPTTVKLYVDGEFVAENTIKMSAPDDLNPIEWEDIFVAKIEEANTYFTSLQAAIDAADGKTVVVLDNITLTETLTVAAGTTVTLDLNGKTVSQTKEQTTGYQMILNDGNLTIVDNTNEKLGKISYTDSGNGGEYVSNTITNRGTITVKSGTIENLSSQTVAQNGYPYAIDSSIWGDASEVNTIVEGGKVHGATYSAIRLRADSNSEPVNVTVSGGEIVGTIEVQVPSSTVAGKGALVISGGKLSNSGTSNVLFFFGSGASAENIEVSVTGGEFTGEITISSIYPIGDNFNNNFITGGTFSTDVNEYCHEYYAAIQGDDNLWRVEQVLFAQTRAFIAGWNWFSSYINLSKDNGLSKLQNAIVQNYENGVGNALIKGQTNNQSVQYDYIGTLEGVDYYDWTGNTFGPVANKMYMIYTSEAIASEDFMIEGEKVDYENTTIALFQGWNWISYPLDEPTLINEALKNFTGATTGDQIKWYGTDFVTYMNGKWYPESFTMMPGEGYMYKAAKQGSFMYSKGTGNNRSDANANMTVENSHWTPEISQYANNMTITAMLSVDDEIVKGDYEIAAFANGECRGSARPIYVEELDAYVLLMAVFGEDVEELTFKYYDVNYETEYELSNRINYSNDAVVGSIDEPYMFNLDILNIGETSVENISIYPNPTTTGSEINLQAVCDKVEVFNALGVKVAEYTNVDSIDAIETAGVYVIRLTIDNSARNCRLIVK